MNTGIRDGVCPTCKKKIKGDCRDDANRYNYDDEGNMINAKGEGVRLYLFEVVEEDYQIPS